MFDATPLFRSYAAWRLPQLAWQRPAVTQERQLLALVRRAAATRFGRAHDFQAIRSVGDFQAAVPLRDYEAMWRDWWQADFPRHVDLTWPGVMPYFALTSGTSSGTTKYIPCSHEMNEANRKVTADLICFHLRNRPRSRLLGGENFMLGGSSALRQLTPDVQAGDLSGITAGVIPWWARLRYFPPAELEAIADWEDKIARMAPLSLRRDIRSISGTPSWLLLYFDHLAALRPGLPRRLAAYWPNLELLIHGGVNFAPYRPLFADWLADSHAETREAYAASEGFIAVADRGDGDGLRLSLDAGMFFEFVPADEFGTAEPTRHWLGNVEPGINYVLVMSSCAGVWSYIVGDTVRFIDLEPPRLLVTGRTSYTLSAFGEHLIDEEVEAAVSAAAADIAARVVDYSVGAVFPGGEERLGGHVYVVEFAGSVPDAAALAQFAAVLDGTLAEANEDYAAHRAGGFGMRPPRVQAAVPGSFAAWMRSRGQLGGQHKVPRIINDDALFAGLQRFVEEHRPAGD